MNNQKTADTYDILRQKWKVVLNGSSSYDTVDPDIASRIAAITADAKTHWGNMDISATRTYLWKDLDSTTDSRCILHSYNRLKDMTLAYCTKGSILENNKELLNDIKNAMDWMYINRYNENTIKYYPMHCWEVTIPMYINDITVMLYSELSTEQISNYMNAVDHFAPDPGIYYGVKATGANNIWKSTVVAVRGIIVKDSKKIARARDVFGSVFPYITGGEGGFYSDGSFVQHEKHPYNGGYGVGLLLGAAKLLYLLDGSEWDVMHADKLNAFQWVYNAFEPLLFNGEMMDMVRGREISRKDSTAQKAGLSILHAILYLMQIAPIEDANYFKKLAKYMIGIHDDFYYESSVFSIELAKAVINDIKITKHREFIKYKQYPNMDRAVQHRLGYAFAISMYSSRTYNYESFFGENLRGWHTADGMTYLYNSDTSQFADNFWPTVDSYRLPGTTVNQYTAITERMTSSRSWVGGTGILGIYGVTGMDLNPPGKTLSAKKSWFMFDDEIICLGAGISSNDGNITETIVENRKLNSEGNNVLTVNGITKTPSLGWSEIMNGVEWIHLRGSVHGSDIGYYFPGAATIHAKREQRTGKWSDINAFDVHVGTSSYTNNFLTLWIEHGTNPVNGSYSYAIIPNKTCDEVRAYAGNPDYTVLENSEDAQAVKENTLNIIGVNFWKDRLKTVDIITCDKKASLLVKENEGNDIEISVSDPTMENCGCINIQVNKSASGVIFSDPEVTVNQLSPTIMFCVNVNAAKGKTFNIKLRL